MKAFDVSLGDLEMQDAYYRALYYRIVPESAIIESHKAANLPAPLEMSTA
jgi:hypothetical protein